MGGHFVSRVGKVERAACDRSITQTLPPPYFSFRFPRRNVHLIDRRFGIPQPCLTPDSPRPLRYLRYIETLARFPPTIFTRYVICDIGRVLSQFTQWSFGYSCSGEEASQMETSVIKRLSLSLERLAKRLLLGTPTLDSRRATVHRCLSPSCRPTIPRLAGLAGLA